MSTAIYIRASQDRDQTRTKVGAQLERCRELCDLEGWEVADIFEDNDLSAFARKRPRPAHEAMMDLVRAGQIERIVTWHLDRLYRQPRELEDLIDAADAGRVRIETVEGSPYDLNSIEGRKAARDVVNNAVYESEKMGWRISQKKERMASEGLPAGGGIRAFGFARNGIDHEPAEAKLLREAAERVLAGESLGAICWDWAERGIRTPGTRRNPTGNPWSVGSLRGALTRPRLAGLREYRGEIIGDAQWEAILAREQWEQLRAVLNDPSRKQRGPRRRYLLAGIGRCAECGRALRSQLTDRGYFTYACRSEPGFRCGKIRVKGPDLDELVREVVFAALDNPELMREPEVSSELSDAQAELERAETLMDQLVTDFASDRISRREWLKAREIAEKRAQDARSVIEAKASNTTLRGLPSGSAAVREAWGSQGIEWRRTLVRAVLDRVVVHPASKGGVFDASRVEFIWRA